jgi:hypothetical protein
VDVQCKARVCYDTLVPIQILVAGGVHWQLTASRKKHRIWLALDGGFGRSWKAWTFSNRIPFEESRLDRIKATVSSSPRTNYIPRWQPLLNKPPQDILKNIQNTSNHFRFVLLSECETIHSSRLCEVHCQE